MLIIIIKIIILKIIDSKGGGVRDCLHFLGVLFYDFVVLHTKILKIENLRVEFHN